MTTDEKLHKLLNDAIKTLQRALREANDFQDSSDKLNRVKITHAIGLVKDIHDRISDRMKQRKTPVDPKPIQADRTAQKEAVEKPKLSGKQAEAAGKKPVSAGSPSENREQNKSTSTMDVDQASRTRTVEGTGKDRARTEFDNSLDLTDDQIIAIDEILVANTSSSWQKALKLVEITAQEVAANGQPIPDLFFASRIRKLVEKGFLESQGNLVFMRYCEVRLKERPQNDREISPPEQGEAGSPSG